MFVNFLKFCTAKKPKLRKHSQRVSEINQPSKYNEELSFENLNKIQNVKLFLPTNSNMQNKILPTHLVPIATQIVLHILCLF